MSKEKPILKEYSAEDLVVVTDGYDNTPGRLKGTRHTFPVGPEGQKVIMQLFKSKVVSPEAHLADLPNWTLVTMGGGASGAMESAGVIKRIADASAQYSADADSKPQFNLSSIVSVSHPEGAAREQKIIDNEDLHQSAELVVYALMDSRIGVSDSQGFVLWGFSSGASTMIEVARILQKRGHAYKLVLIEPAATSSHPQLVRNLLLDTNLDTLRHFYLEQLKTIDKEKPGTVNRLGYGRYPSLFRKALREVLTSMTTPDGAPSLPGVLFELLYGGNARLNQLAQEYGLPKSADGVLLRDDLLKRDATADARQELKGEVILVASSFAKALNLLVAHEDVSDGMLNALWGWWETGRLGYKLELYKELKKHVPILGHEQLMARVRKLTSETYLSDTYKVLFQKLFPNASGEVVAEPTGLHSGIMRQEGIHSMIFQKLHNN